MMEAQGYDMELENEFSPLPNSITFVDFLVTGDYNSLLHPTEKILDLSTTFYYCEEQK